MKDTKTEARTYHCEKFNISVSTQNIVDAWSKPEPLLLLDQMLADYVANPRTAKKRDWLSALRQGLQLTLTDVAAQLNMTRQSVLEIEQRELNQRITVAKLERMATQYGCEFIYGFAPQDHATFAEMLVDQIAPNVIKPDPVMKKPKFGYAIMLSARISQYLKKRKAKPLLTRPKGFEVSRGL